MIAVSFSLLHMSSEIPTSNLVDLLCCVLKYLVPFLLVLFDISRLDFFLLLGLLVLLGILDLVHSGKVYEDSIVVISRCVRAYRSQGLKESQIRSCV